MLINEVVVERKSHKHYMEEHIIHSNDKQVYTMFDGFP